MTKRYRLHGTGKTDVWDWNFALHIANRGATEFNLENK